MKIDDADATLSLSSVKVPQEFTTLLTLLTVYTHVRTRLEKVPILSQSHNILQLQLLKLFKFLVRRVTFRG